MKKRLISLLLACIMLLACIPAMAANTDTDSDGLDVVILIDRSGSMITTDPGSIALTATKMFADRCNARNNSVAVVTYGYDIIHETAFYDLSSPGRLEQLRNEVDSCTIPDRQGDTNTGMALEHVYNNTIAARKAIYQNHDFAILVISDGQIQIGDSQAFRNDDRYPDKGQATQNMLIRQSKQAGADTAQRCAAEGIPIYCLGIYSSAQNILGDDMSNWSNTTGGIYNDTDNINDVYDIIREMYLDMTGNPDPVAVTDGRFTVPANTLEANVEIVPSINADDMTLTRPDGTTVDLSGRDSNVSVRQDEQYTMIKLTSPMVGEWEVSFDDGSSRELSVYITCNLDLDMVMDVPAEGYNYDTVNVRMVATRQRVPYHDPSQNAILTITNLNTGNARDEVMTFNETEGKYEYYFTPQEVGSYKFAAKITTDVMTNVTTNESVMEVRPRPVRPAQELGAYQIAGHMIGSYEPVIHDGVNLHEYFVDLDHRGIVGFEAVSSAENFVTATADFNTGVLTYYPVAATSSPVTITVYALDGLGERSEPLIGQVTIENAASAIELNTERSIPSDGVHIKAILPQKSGKAVLRELHGYFVEPNANDGESITNVVISESHAYDTEIIEAQIVNDELVLRGLRVGETDIVLTASSSDGSTVDLPVHVSVSNLLFTLLLIGAAALLGIVVIILVIVLILHASKPAFKTMGSLTITLSGEDQYVGTKMMGSYGKKKVKLGDICRAAGMFTGSFGDMLNKITVTPTKSGVSVQCALKNVAQRDKSFTLRDLDSRTIVVDPANDYTITIEYYTGN